MSVHIISKMEAKQILDSYPSDGTIFTVTFMKRGGGLRKMNCRKGVKKGVKGVGLGYDPKKHNLVPVYDVQKAIELKKIGETEKKAFRMISVEGILSMTIKGVSYTVK